MFAVLLGCGGPLTAIEASRQADGLDSGQQPRIRPGAAEPEAVSARKAGFTPDGPVVALGDSYTAGLLLPLDSSAKPVGCFRSTVTYASRVAAALHAPAYASAACQSAGVVSLYNAAQTADGVNPPQLDSLAPDDSLVMMTLGGDDLSFSHVLKGCMDPFSGPCQDHYWYLNQQISAEKPKMITALHEIHRRAPHARVLLLGYPDLFPARGGCWPIAPFTSHDMAFLRSSELKLNAMLAQAAADTGTTYVDTYGPTIGHDMCQGSRVKDVEGLIPSSTAMSFHPNARGQEAMARQVLATLGSKQGLRALGVSAGGAAHGAGSPGTGLGEGPGQFLGQAQQRVGSAGHHILRQVGYPDAARPRRAPQQVKGIPGPQAVPLRQHADGLLHLDPGSQGVLKLGNGHREPLRLHGRSLAAGRGLVPGPAVGARRRRLRGVAAGLLGREQVSQHHGAGEVRHLLVAHDPAVLALAHHDVVVPAGNPAVCSVGVHVHPCSPLGTAYSPPARAVSHSCHCVPATTIPAIGDLCELNAEITLGGGGVGIIRSE